MERRVAVDIIAWIFIVLAGLSILAGGLQLVLMPPLDLSAHQDTGLFRYMKAIAVMKITIMSILLASSAGLLRRRNPARLVFIVVTLLGIAWNVADFVMRAWLGISVSLLPGSVNHAHITASFSLLSAWAVWALTRPSVRAEFIDSLKV